MKHIWFGLICGVIVASIIGFAHLMAFVVTTVSESYGEGYAFCTVLIIINIVAAAISSWLNQKD